MPPGGTHTEPQLDLWQWQIHTCWKQQGTPVQGRSLLLLRAKVRAWEEYTITLNHEFASEFLKIN